MKTVARMSLEEGMILGEEIEDRQGNTLYPAGSRVDAAMIAKLNRYNIMCVSIKEDVDFATTHYEKMRFDEDFRGFESLFTRCLHTYKVLMRTFLETGRKTEDTLLLQLYQDLRAKAPTGGILLDYLYNMVPNEDELTYTHCLNSALLAGAFADWLNMDEEARQIFILCGFYYDIGKLKLPYELLWKPDRLTSEEFEQVKAHTIIGYSLVKELKLNPHVKNAVIMHHERLDGSGYPYHMQGNNIDIFARYIAIVDAYIAMASPRSYRAAMPPLQILDHFEKSRDKFDVQLLMPLMERIAEAQIGTHVQLSDNTEWEVLIIHPNQVARPILKNASAQILDLQTCPDLSVTKNL